MLIEANTDLTTHLTLKVEVLEHTEMTCYLFNYRLYGQLYYNAVNVDLFPPYGFMSLEEMPSLLLGVISLLDSIELSSGLGFFTKTGEHYTEKHKKEDIENLTRLVQSLNPTQS